MQLIDVYIQDLDVGKSGLVALFLCIVFCSGLLLSCYICPVGFGFGDCFGDLFFE